MYGWLSIGILILIVIHTFRILKLKVNCLSIFNFLDNNLSFVLFLELVFIFVKSDSRQELW